MKHKFKIGEKVGEIMREDNPNALFGNGYLACYVVEYTDDGYVVSRNGRKWNVKECDLVDKYRLSLHEI